MNRLQRAAAICMIGPCLLVACLPERVTVLSPDDEILDDFIDEYYRERFSFYPSQSSEAGFPGHDDELERFDEESIRDRIAWLADFRLRLIAVRVEELSRFSHPEALWLRSEVESELWFLEQWASWRHQVDFYLRPARSGLRALMTRSPGDMVSPLLGRLEGFVALCRAARQNLVAMSPAERQASLDAIRHTEAFVMSLLNLVLPDVRDHERLELRASRDAVMGELRELRTHVRALPGSENRRALGEAGFRKYWIYSAMVDMSTSEMELMTEEAIGRLRGEIDDSLLLHFSGEPLQDVLRRLSRLEVPSETASEISSLVESLAQGSTPLGRIRLDAATRVEMSSDEVIAPRVVRLIHAPPLEPIAEGLALVSTSRSQTAAGWLQAMTEAVREIVGAAVQNEYRSRSMSLLRKAGSTRTTREGWQLAVQSRLLRDSSGGGVSDWPSAEAFQNHEGLHEILRLFVLRETLIEHVRLLASIRFHRDRIDDLQIREVFASLAYLDAGEQEREWSRVQLDPGVGSAALGMMLLRGLQREFRRKYPASEESMFYEKFLQAGILPLRLVRFRLLGETDVADPPFREGLRRAIFDETPD